MMQDGACFSALFLKDKIGDFYFILTLLSQCQIFTMRYGRNVLLLGSDIFKMLFIFLFLFFFFKE